MAAAFAGRGAGSCAVAPTNAVRNNAGVIESGTLAAKLLLGPPSLADDVVSIDHDGVLDPGESGLLRITLANGGAVAAEEVTVTATTMNAGVKIGAPLHLPLLAPFASVDVAIPVSLLASAPPNTPLTITIHVNGDFTCTRDGVTVVLTTPSGISAATTSMMDMPVGTDEPIVDASRVLATFQAPATSLRAADAAVCIANDTP
jgi:hypothetical protein